MLSPSYPQNYTAGQVCLYSITVPEEFGKGFFVCLSTHRPACRGSLACHFTAPPPPQLVAQ